MTENINDEEFVEQYMKGGAKFLKEKGIVTPMRLECAVKSKNVK